MKIITKSIATIDYENRKYTNREIPPSFGEKITNIIDHINNNKSVRNYIQRSSKTEVINCILEIKNNNGDDSVKYSDTISNRLLLREEITQERNRQITQVRKGVLLQSLLCNENDNTYYYIIAKISYTKYVDDSDLMTRIGFPADGNNQWKSCLFNLTDEGTISAKVYTDNVAKYWSDDFLELDHITNDEYNTKTAYSSIDALLNIRIKSDHIADRTNLKNAFATYLRINGHIDYYDMVDNIFDNYEAVSINSNKLENIKEMVKNLPIEKKFDAQFNSDKKTLNKLSIKTYNLNDGIQLKISGTIDKNIVKIEEDTSGKCYVKILTTSEQLYKDYNK